jgi:hypothetical protein
VIVWHPFRHYRPAPWRRGGRYRARLDDVWEAAIRWALARGYRYDSTYGIVDGDGRAFAPI